MVSYMNVCAIEYTIVVLKIFIDNSIDFDLIYHYIFYTYIIILKIIIGCHEIYMYI